LQFIIIFSSLKIINILRQFIIVSIIINQSPVQNEIDNLSFTSAGIEEFTFASIKNIINNMKQAKLAQRNILLYQFSSNLFAKSLFGKTLITETPNATNKEIKIRKT